MTVDGEVAHAMVRRRIWWEVGELVALRFDAAQRHVAELQIGYTVVPDGHRPVPSPEVVPQRGCSVLRFDELGCLREGPSGEGAVHWRWMREGSERYQHRHERMQVSHGVHE